MNSFHTQTGPHGPAALQRWYNSRLGRALAEDERIQWQSLLGDVSGGQGLIQAPPGPRKALLSALSLDEAWTLAMPAASPGSVVGDLEHLPFLAESFSLVVAYHGLEFCPQPRQALAEVDRVLEAEGYLLWVGFNPASLLGLSRKWRTWGSSLPTGMRLWSAAQVRRWLQARGYAIVDSRHCFFRLPVDHPGWLAGSRILDALGPRLCPGLGGVSMILVQKKVLNVIPLKDRWRVERQPSGSMAEPTVRSLH